MKENEETIHNFFNKIIGLKAENIIKRYGISVYIEFGKKIKKKIKRGGKWKIIKRGKWQFATLMGLWKIYNNKSLIACCEDSDKIIEKAFEKINNKKLTNVELLNGTYDLRLEFDKTINFYLFSVNIDEKDASNWMLFTPDYKLLSVGPGNLLEYEDSGETPLN